jgi:hypothetical protein
MRHHLSDCDRAPGGLFDADPGRHRLAAQSTVGGGFGSGLFHQQNNRAHHGLTLANLLTQVVHLGRQGAAGLKGIARDQKRAVDAAVAHRFQDLRRRPSREGPFDPPRRLGANQRNQGHRRLPLLPGKLLVKAHVGIEKHKVRGKRVGFEHRPLRGDPQAHRQQLPAERGNHRMRAVQDDGMRAAQINDADAPHHDTTRRRRRVLGTGCDR